jgi:hypothetical protein
MRDNKPRYFAQPDPGQEPLGYWRMLLIILSTHLGVRNKQQRADDFSRANGLHIFIGGVVYFMLVISGLLLLIKRVIL